MEPGKLFVFGLGFTGRRLAHRLRGQGWQVAGTTRSAAARDALIAEGIAAVLFERDRPLPDPAAALAGTTHLVVSVPPGNGGDPVLDAAGEAIAAAGIRWAGYLSTTGVYGDTHGAEVDETSALRPTSDRSARRVAAEGGWLAWGRAHGVPLHVFRLAGIYGPGRSVLDQLRAGTARAVARPGHRFSRIHVDDIVEVLLASFARPHGGAIYNVCDDEPAEPSAVIAYAAALLGLPAPLAVPYEQAAPGMTPMARSFWRDHRLVANRRIKDELGVALRYPDYRAGLRAVLAETG